MHKYVYSFWALCLGFGFRLVSLTAADYEALLGLAPLQALRLSAEVAAVRSEVPWSTHRGPLTCLLLTLVVPW